MDWKALVGTVAPVLGTALGGPLGGMAVKAIAAALGLSEETEEAVAAAISGAKPEDLLKLKQADQQFAKDMKALDIDLERVHGSDRKSAREREMAVKDAIPGMLALLVTAGFFGVLFWMLMYGTPKNGGSEALLIMLGALGAAWGSVVAYYFGSSSQQAKQSAVLHKIASAP